MPKLDETARGVYVISITPFDDKGALDYGSTDRLMDYYLKAGVDGLTILGMMGEAPKLTQSESLAFARHVLQRIAGRVPVIVGVSNPGLAAMKELANDVMAAGAAGVMVAPTPNLRTDGDILRYFGTVAETLGPDIPWVLQDYPLVLGVQIATEVILKVVEAHKNCVMLKHEDWPGLNKIGALRAASNAGKGRRISILIGNGGLFLPEELVRGADGAMTGFAFPEMMVEVCRAHAAGQVERAFDLFDAYLPLARYEQQQAIGLPLRKEVLKRRGIITSAALRKPGPTLTPGDHADLDRLLRRLEKRLAEIG